ncbi:MAG: hypothetical protein LBH72_04670 [Proteiniphilum sp.]|jgi:hypothetical protein|nr:hypothetical protein [Proteiniphilum sp.]
MTQQLHYEIAGYHLLIDTPNAEITDRLLPSFSPFRLHDEKNVHTDLLFRFTGNTHISLPDANPVEMIEEAGALFRVYNSLDGITIAIAWNETEHIIHISLKQKLVVGNMTLVRETENKFLAHFLRAAFGIVAAYRKTIKVHASVIEKEGKALVFLGRSGTGKSTHSRLWKEFVPGCTLLNDDEPVVQIADDGSVRVYGTPWSGSTPCYRNASAEIAAFVHLYQSPENRLTQIKGVHAFTSLLQSAAVLRSDGKNRELVISIVEDILKKVPVYRLDNRPDREAVRLTETLMASREINNFTQP